MTEIQEGSWIIPAVGHSLVKTDARAATCTEAGNTAYWTCMACGKYYSDENGVTEIQEGSWVTPALGHSWNSGEVTKAATCTEEGVMTYTCTRCGVTKTEKIDALGHDLMEIAARAATCTEPGNSAYWTCTVCGKYFSDAEGTREIAENSWIIPAKGHSMVKTDSKAATCAEPGNSEYWTCTVCGKHFSDEEGVTEIQEGSWIIPAKAHSLVKTEAKEASCTETGNTAYWTCTACGKFFSDEEGAIEIQEGSWVTPALGHSWNSGEVTKAATCTEEGVMTYTCTRCGETKTEKIDALGHDLMETAARAATCTEPGNSAYWTCTVCGKYFSDAEGTREIAENSWIIPAKGHSMTKTDAKAANCTEPGNSAYWTCTVCGKHFSDAEGTREIAENSWIIPAPGHIWNSGEVITQATCTHEGEMLYTCTVCGATRTEVIAMLLHHLMEVPAKDPTCTLEGNSEYYVCDSCGHYFSDPDGTNEIQEGSWVIKAKGHVFGDWEIVVAPSCENHGSKQRTCTVCEYTETEDMDLTDHDWEEEFTVDQEPGCTTDGSKSRHCRNCGQKTDVTVIPALGHDWDTDHVVFNWSEDLSEAEAVFTCLRDPSHVETVKAAVTSETAAGIITYTATVVFDNATYSDQKTANAHEVTRIFGESRYDTCIKIADYYLERNKAGKLPAIVIATGNDFPDALTGAYLANVMKAPIMLIDLSNSARITTYIRNHLADDGTVYILGGTGVVEDEWLAELSGYNLKRLDGQDRFETNLSILGQSGATGGDIFVCTGTNYADSLSASAIKMPILIVGGSLTKAQKDYLAGGSWNFHLVGGTSVVSEEIEKELTAYGTIADRTYGPDRYATSRAMAERFLGEPQEAILAYGANFPDGLCGGPLAYTMGAPMILSGSKPATNAAGIDYAAAKNITYGLVLGGDSLIDDQTVRTTFAMSETDEIKLFE